MGFQRSLSDSDRDRRLNPHPEANTLRAVPRQLYLPRIASNKCCRHSVAQGLLAYPATKLEIAGHRRRKDPLQRIYEPDLGILPSDVFWLIDTRCDSPKGHYVNRVADALLKATRISIGVPAASCDETPSGIWYRFYMCRPIALKAASSK